jgi:hypothetical protein
MFIGGKVINQSHKKTRMYLLWLAMTPQPACLDIFTASILSVTEPI